MGVEPTRSVIAALGAIVAPQNPLVVSVGIHAHAGFFFHTRLCCLTKFNTRCATCRISCRQVACDYLSSSGGSAPAYEL
jgi:hypothetical protein